MKLGQDCPLSGEKLGRKFSNGGFKRDKTVFKQISLIYKYPVDPKNLEKGFKPEPTYVHIPIHKCALENGLSDDELATIEKAIANDKNVRIFTDSAPDAVLDGWAEDDLSSVFG